jgi:hemoglobin
MQPRTRGWYGVIAAALLAVGASGAAQAGEGDVPLERKALDQKLHRTLRDVINRGAETYNTGDPAGCYQIFRGALMTAHPLLDHHPELQKSIAAALADAERSPDPRRRAWVLRRSLDEVRAQVGGKDASPAVAGSKPLWERLGGEAGVKKVVDEWVALVADDAKANFTRDGKFKPTDEDLSKFKASAVAWISSQTGGPIQYTGKSMKDAHKDMGITDGEFDAVLADLLTVLKKNGVARADVDTIRAAVEKTRKDIVEVAGKKEDMPKEKDKEDVPKKDTPKEKDKEDVPKKEKDEEKKDKEKDKDEPKEKDKDKDKEKDEKKEKDEEKKDKEKDKE